TWLLRSASPRLRHALWLLVLAKVFLPPGLATPVSVGRWGVGPLRDAIGLSAWDAKSRSPLAERAESSGPLENESRSAPKLGQASPITGPTRSSLPLLFGLWAAGCLLFWAFVVGRYARLVRAVRSFPTVDEGPLRIALERIAIDLGLRRVPDVVAADMVTSPFLFGVIRPTIVLPQGLLARWTDAELRAVLAHELVHWQRGDTWLGWLQTIAQGLFWFHPFLWWANGQLRHQRECACDEAVLRREGIAPEPYGEAIVRMLTMLRGRSLVSGSLGIFEVGTNLQHRLEEIMNYHPLKRRFGWLSRLAIVATAVLLLPMSPGAGDRPTAIAQEAAAPADNAKPKDAHPRIVKSSPPQGATGVDPALKEISVTFDRDMEQGRSWTGGPPLFPPVEKSRQARWTDKRTCVLPVKLEAGAYYRLGINSSSYQNFRAKEGVAAASAAIYFSTKGATQEVERRVRVPAIVSLHTEGWREQDAGGQRVRVPIMASLGTPNGSNDVEPTTASLRVTFSVPMGEGMSWTGGGAEFPKIPDGKTASWSDDGLTCTLPVSLEPEHGYQLGLNSVSHNNFQSKWGVPLEAVVYKFQTGAAAH
ncbi:MAG TPA: M56 family metallopeptidase, partial [Pirellulales bacterium]|nr:M56 family metallopeptidase [Pirellulales bacterium]